MNNSKNGGGFVSLGLCDAIFIVFLVLKLCGVIDWSWWWVTAPLWIPLALLVVVLIILCGVLIICKIIDWFRYRF